jgi:hypothetical protein
MFRTGNLYYFKTHIVRVMKLTGVHMFVGLIVITICQFIPIRSQCFNFLFVPILNFF